jgi:hypothetical protein
MPVELFTLWNLTGGNRERVQRMLLDAGMLDHLVAPLGSDPFSRIDVQTEEELDRLLIAALRNGVRRPLVRRVMRPTERELRAAPLLHMVAWVHVTGERAPRPDTCYDLTRACPACGAGTQTISPLILRRAELPRRPPLGTVSGTTLVFHDELVDAVATAGLTGFAFVRALDRSGHPLSWHELRVEHVLPPMTVASTGLVRGKTGAEAPCGRCGRDGFFDDAEHAFAPTYPRTALNGLPDIAATYEHFGTGALTEPFHDSRLAAPRVIVRPAVRDLFRALKIRGVRFTPVAVR